MATPSEIRDELLKEFYNLYMKHHDGIWPRLSFDDAHIREVDWLIRQGG